jgi:hypothetical protein
MSAPSPISWKSLVSPLKATTRLDALEAANRFVRAVKQGTPGSE